MVIVIADQYVSYLITILSYEADRGGKTINSTTWWTETVINFIILGLSNLVVFFFSFTLATYVMLIGVLVCS